MWQRDSGNNASSSPAKKRSAVGSALRFAYVPRFGHNLGEMGRVFGLFPRLLAGIFAMKGMFPRQHPALRDEALRLRITDVLSTAFATLEWNRAGVPRILFFFAVVASLVFSIVAAVFAILGFFSAPAHAIPGMFTSPSPTTDLGNTWLDHIFRQQDFRVQVPLTDANNVPSQITTTTIGGELPLLFSRLAGMYSTAMLVLAVIILVYHLISMTAMTAHEGTAMGRSANKVWAPVRLVFALGLLVPIANGFSSGQWLIAWIAKQGSGLASYVWGNAGTGIGASFIAQGEESRTSPVTLPIQMLTNLATIGACGVGNQMGDGKNVPGAGTNWYRRTASAAQLSDPYNSLIIAQSPAGGNPASVPAAAAVNTAGKAYSIILGGQQVNTQAQTEGLYSQNFMPYFRSNGGSGAYQTWNDVKPCGQVTFPEMSVDPNLAAGNPRDADMVNALSNAHIRAYRSVYYNALRAGAAHRAAHASQGTLDPTTRANLTLPDGSSPDNLGPYLERLAVDYRTTFAANVNGAVPGLSYDAVKNEIVYRPSSTNALLQARLSGNPLLGQTNGDLGWMSAAGFYLKMATSNSLLQRAANNTPLVTTGFGGVVGDVEKQIALTVGYKGEQVTSINGVTTRSVGGDVGNILSDFVMKIMAAIGLANDRGQWIWQTQFTSNYPLSDILNLGQKLINSALTCIWVGAALNLVMAMASNNIEAALAKAFPQAQNVGDKESDLMAMLKKIGSIPPAVFDSILGYIMNAGAVLLAAIPTMLFALAGIMLLPGIILFFVLPTLPFLNFMTGILTWMISLLSAVVAIPVIAIAHLTPQGEGLPSQTARGAYTMILQIFLRPVMMVFGLLIFVLVMNTGIPILNTLFFGIYKLTASGGVPGLLSNMAFFVLYAAAAFGICNIAISAIDDLPMKAVQWIGGSTIDTNHDVSKLGAYIMAQGAQGAIQGGLSSINQATRNGNMIGNAQNAVAARNAAGGGGGGFPGMPSLPGAGPAAGLPGAPSVPGNPIGGLQGAVINGLKTAAVGGLGVGLFQAAQGKNPDVFGAVDKLGGAFQNFGGVNSSLPNYSNAFGQSNPSNPGAAAADQNIPAASTVAPTNTSVAPPASPPDPNPGVASAGAAGFIRGSGSSPTAPDKISQLLFPNGAPQIGRPGDEIASASVPRSSGGLQSPGVHLASANTATRQQGGSKDLVFPVNKALNFFDNLLGYDKRKGISPKDFGDGSCFDRVADAVQAALGGRDYFAQQAAKIGAPTGSARDASVILKSDSRFDVVATGSGSTRSSGYKPLEGDIVVFQGGKHGHIAMFAGYDTKGNERWMSFFDTAKYGDDWTGVGGNRGSFEVFRQDALNDGRSSVGGGGSRDVSGMERDDFVVEYMMSKGWSRIAAVSIAANIEQESTFRHDVWNEGKSHYGLAQWDATRRARFEEVMGKDITQSTMSEQLDFVDWELRNTHTTAGDKLMRATSLRDGVDAFAGDYEIYARRGTGEYNRELEERIDVAEKIASGDYNSAAVPDGTTMDGGGGGGSSDGGGGGNDVADSNFNFYEKAIAGLAYITKKQYNVASGKIEETRA